jgi:hypothetical protein
MIDPSYRKCQNFQQHEKVRRLHTTAVSISMYETSFLEFQTFPSNGMNSMNRTLMGLSCVNLTKLLISSSFRPRITTVFTCRHIQRKMSYSGVYFYFETFKQAKNTKLNYKPSPFMISEPPD